MWITYTFMSRRHSNHQVEGCFAGFIEWLMADGVLKSDVWIKAWCLSQHPQMVDPFSSTLIREVQPGPNVGDGLRDLEADVILCQRLAASGHWSPFEHVAMALKEPQRHSNFVGWRQFRLDVDVDN